MRFHRRALQAQTTELSPHLRIRIWTGSQGFALAALPAEAADGDDVAQWLTGADGLRLSSGRTTDRGDTTVRYTAPGSLAARTTPYSAKRDPTPPERTRANMASSSTPATPLLYSCIAYHSTILAEHTTSAASGVSGLAAVILPKIQHDSPQKLTYTHNQNFIHYIADGPPSSSNPDHLSASGLTYLVVAKSDLGRRLPFGYLVGIKKRFLSEYDAERTDFAALPAYGAAAFNGQLRQLMVDYGTTQAGQNDAFANVQSDIDNVRGIMTENIERVLERGERMDLLVDKTDRLGGSARDFRVRSRGLRRKMWWKNIRLMALLVVVVIFLLYLLVGFGCGLPAWSKCVHR